MKKFGEIFEPIVLTRNNNKYLSNEDGEEEEDEKKLGSMVRMDRNQWNSSHEALKVDWFFEHLSKLILKWFTHVTFDHLNRG